MFNITYLPKALKQSSKGLMAAFRHEITFRHEVLLSIILIPLGLFLGGTPSEKALLVTSVLLWLIIELINSAIEVTIDRVGTERHELSGRAKDIGSAAVFMAVINLVITWSIIIFF